MDIDQTISKDKVKKMTRDMEKPWNKKLVAEYLLKIDNIPDEEWESFINKFININGSLEEWLKEKFELRLGPNIELNELISYSNTEDILHIHVLPKDVTHLIHKRDYIKLKFIDALEKIKVILQQDENMQEITNVFAASPILKIKFLQNMFEELGFNIEETMDEQILERFPETKKVYEANLSKDEILSDEWEENKENILNNISNNPMEM